ncbi:LysM peptidoglycan-binding domain-containing protein [Listeria aquatica]|uniref:LysM peptidoglycan-binding domain-containing protein n=1 Tax=Listeria aquatica TaxID=1494960 RepID=A0A841ZLW1_9LIST|nr:LysM peptidoglycan-binding domain-containing protein [Listeria aquatica]MBC1520502.1 LysM peptidoglycan-binding domain-containing protein [Listeria aquatica]
MARKRRNDEKEYTPSDDYDHDFYNNSEDEFNDEPPMLSRSDSRKAKKTGIFRYPLLNVLIIFFLLIPIVVVIVFVAVQNSGQPDNTVKEESSVSVDNNTKAKQEAKEKAAKEKAAKEKAAKEKAAKEKATKEKEEKEKAAKEKAEADEKAKQDQAAQQAAAEKAAAEKAAADKQAAAERAEQERQNALKAEQERKAAEEAKKQAEAAQASSHTVQAGETLYRIAVNAYGASNATQGVQKIKQANGLSSDSVPVGTVIKIPK